MTILQKSYSRGSLLAEAMVWRDANCGEQETWLGYTVKDVLFLRPDERDLLEVWYSEREGKRYKEAIVEKIRGDSRWFEKAVERFNAEWEYLFPAMTSAHALSPDELEEYHRHFIRYWPPMGIMDVIPDIPALPEAIRATALQLRADRQRHSNLTDEPYIRTVRAHYPQLAPYAHVLQPAELFAGTIPDAAELEARKKGWFMTCDAFGTTEMLPETMKVRGWEFEKNDTTVSEVKGSVAYPGKVVGAAKIISTKKDIGKVKEGDILITPMTSPSFLPYMRLAAAFVTDEGGITCHAAIVAREMGKPCIIGTKIATQVFKDGDMVEVDAEKGMVRIVKD